MRADDAGWLGKHLLPGIAGGFDLGILQLGDMGRWQHRRNDVAVGRQTPWSQADSCDPRANEILHRLQGPGAAWSWLLYSSGMVRLQWV